MDNLPITEMDLRILSVVALPEAKSNPVVNGAINRLCTAVMDARIKGEKSVTIPLDAADTSVNEVARFVREGEQDIKSISGLTSIGRLEEVMAGNLNVLRPLNRTELVDIIIFCTSIIENSQDALELITTAKVIIGLKECINGSL